MLEVGLALLVGTVYILKHTLIYCKYMKFLVTSGPVWGPYSR